MKPGNKGHWRSNWLGSKEFYLLLVSSVVLIWAVGSRPESVGIDTVGYIYYYEYRTHSPEYGHFEYMFTLLSTVLIWIFAPVRSFLMAVALVDFVLVGCLGKQLVKFTENRIHAATLFFLLAIFFWLSPFFFAVMVNVIRTGPSIFSIFIFYLILAKNNVLSISRVQLLVLIALLIIALGFHHTAIIAIAFSPLVFLGYNTIISTVFVAALYYMSGLSAKIVQLFFLQPDFVWLVSKLHLAEVFNRFNFYDASTTFTRRLDFVLFTLTSGIVFHYLNKYLLLEEDRDIFSRLLKIYWILVLPFFIFGFTLFSDRYLLPGWLYLSVLSAVFCGFYLRKWVISKYWLYGSFVVSAAYFLVRVQGLLVFKLR